MKLNSIIGLELASLIVTAAAVKFANFIIGKITNDAISRALDEVTEKYGTMENRTRTRYHDSDSNLVQGICFLFGFRCLHAIFQGWGSLLIMATIGLPVVLFNKIGTWWYKDEMRKLTPEYLAELNDKDYINTAQKIATSYNNLAAARQNRKYSQDRQSN